MSRKHFDPNKKIKHVTPEKHLKAIKSLGQNFLTDHNLAHDIVALGELVPGERVWEIGPGKGILTDAIMQHGVHLRAFELDRRLPEYLEERYGKQVDFEYGDVLLADWEALIAVDGYPIKLIANIPYQITSPLLARLEEYGNAFSVIILMVQKEVAERLSALSGTKSYAPLSIRLRLNFQISLAIKVGREKFEPSPNVDSAIIVMHPRLDKPVLKYPQHFHPLLIATFAHRRKTLANNLIPLLGKDKMLRLEQLSGLDFKRRGESLDEADFIRLSELMAVL